MNSAIRAVVRTACYHDVKVSGILQGYQGLVENRLKLMGPRNVANILQRGGTILRSARYPEFKQPEVRAVAAQNLHEHGVDGLIVIGGDGSFRGAHYLGTEHDIPVIGLPGTIDNDIAGTDVTIGFNTAMNVALEAIDRLRDTAASHDRLFVVEVMGRNSGHLALNVGVAGGAEEILIPEVPTDFDKLFYNLQCSQEKGKLSSIIVVAEGAVKGGTQELAQRIKDNLGVEVRTTILGHIQRGGSPTTRDRVLASRLGFTAVNGILQGKRDVMAGVDRRGTVFVPLRDTWETRKDVDLHLYEMAKILAI